MTGRADHAVVLQAASLLLQYPDDQLREALPTIRAAVAPLPRGKPRDRLLAFIAHLVLFALVGGPFRAENGGPVAR
jgi:nitrate reductase assembly molybdenum cofactor insertion protein NarJ